MGWWYIITARLATAYQLANGVAEAAFKTAKTIVHTTSTATSSNLWF